MVWRQTYITALTKRQEVQDPLSGGRAEDAKVLRFSFRVTRMDKIRNSLVHSRGQDVEEDVVGGEDTRDRVRWRQIIFC